MLADDVPEAAEGMLVNDLPEAAMLVDDEVRDPEDMLFETRSCQCMICWWPAFLTCDCRSESDQDGCNECGLHDV